MECFLFDGTFTIFYVIEPNNVQFDNFTLNLTQIITFNL